MSFAAAPHQGRDSAIIIQNHDHHAAHGRSASNISLTGKQGRDAHGNHPQPGNHPQTAPAKDPDAAHSSQRGRTVYGMDPFIGSEAIATGALTRGQLRWNYVAMHPNVYLAKEQATTFVTSTHAAWLWTERRGIVAGHAAASLYGVRGIDTSTPIELIASHSRRRRGVIVRSERIDDDEVRAFGPFRMTTPARTALDLGRRLPRDVAVQYLDELARATEVSYDGMTDLLERYRGTRGLPRAREALCLMDGGSNSADETRLRLILADAGLPRPRTSIVVGEGFDTAVIAMGWDKARVGVSVYAGSARETSLAVQHTRRHDVVQLSDWIEIQVADLCWRSQIVFRVRTALRKRGFRV